MMAAAPPCLEAEGLTVRRAGREIVRGASLALGDGAVITIQGASGSGKSTLLRALSTLLPFDAGTLTFRGRDVATLDLPDYRRRVAYVPQLPPMFGGSVADNIRAGPRYRGDEITSATVTRLLGDVGLAADFASRPAAGLSGGERLRVALARALANDPIALLLDEPTSALDPESARVVLRTIASLVTSGTALLAVTHSEAHAAALGGRAYRMTAGVLVESLTGANG